MGGLLSLGVLGLLPGTSWARMPDWSRRTSGRDGARGPRDGYVFWLYLQPPSPATRRLVRGRLPRDSAELTKFSLILLLYGLWPFLCLCPPDRLDDPVSGSGLETSAGPRGRAWGLLMRRPERHAVTIDAGYLFEGVGTPLGRFEFASRSLTRPVDPGMLPAPRRPTPTSSNVAWRLSRQSFPRTCWLDEATRAPLPEARYPLGFDDQKLEAEGFPDRFMAQPRRDAMHPNQKGKATRPQGYPCRSISTARSSRPKLVVLLLADVMSRWSTRSPREP